MKDDEKELRGIVELLIEKVDLMNKKDDISYEILRLRLKEIEERLINLEIDIDENWIKKMTKEIDDETK